MPGPASDSGDGERRKLRWRCRRGMKELDLLLVAWLDRHHAAATSDERATFERLLELPDPDLARYLIAGVQPTDPVLARLTASIAAPDALRR